MRTRLKRRALAEHIAQRHLSQNGFAIKAGLSSGHIAQLLAGKRSPTGPVRQKLLKATGLQFTDLFQVELPDEPNRTNSYQS